MTIHDDGRPRCPWAMSSPLMVQYHDEEWGVPCHDDTALFERLTLEAFQAGLSWTTILHKRENFRMAFAAWDLPRIAAYGPDEIARLMQDSGIVRNRRKIESTIQNAGCVLQLQHELGSFDRYVWSFAPPAEAQPTVWPDLQAMPSATAESTAMAKDMRRRGFRFVGATTCYAFMQSIGMVNDHIQGCFKALT